MKQTLPTLPQNRGSAAPGFSYPLAPRGFCSSGKSPPGEKLTVVGWASVRISASQLPSLRQQPIRFPAGPLPPSLIKHADDQTVAGLAALSLAIQGHGLEKTDFSTWGVIAAPRFLGRTALAAALARFADEGAWGISPHLIPHRSLHSLSGTISQALRIQGPNYGVGGGAVGASEAVLAACAMLADGAAPGVLVVLTGFDPELAPPDPAPMPSPETVSDCVAVALALAPLDVPVSRSPHFQVSGGQSHVVASVHPFTLENLAATLKCGNSSARWQLGCGGWAMLQFPQVGNEGVR